MFLEIHLGVLDLPLVVALLAGQALQQVDLLLQGGAGLVDQGLPLVDLGRELVPGLLQALQLFVHILEGQQLHQAFFHRGRVS